MKALSIEDAGDLLALDGEGKFTLGLIDRLRTGHSVALMDEARKACVIYDPMWSGKWVAHILSAPEARGKALWNFTYASAKWMIERMGLQVALIFADKNNRVLNRFITYSGLKPEATVGNEFMYIADVKYILDLNGGETCHQL